MQEARGLAKPSDQGDLRSVSQWAGVEQDPCAEGCVFPMLFYYTVSQQAEVTAECWLCSCDSSYVDLRCY